MPKGTTDRRMRRHLRALTDEGRIQRNQQTNRARTGIGVSSKLVRDENPEPGATAIASPLTEFDAAERVLHPETDITSTDGLFVIKVRPVETIFLDDANGIEVEFNYKDPYNP